MDHIETGRYCNKNRLSPSERKCNICNKGETEDEFHFVMLCSKYNTHRKDLFDSIQQMYPKFQNLDNAEKFIWLMSNSDKKVLVSFSAYVYFCFQARPEVIASN